MLATAVMTLAALVVSLGGAPQARAAVGDVQYPVPAGANNWQCRPSASHPNPVVLVHGTFVTMAENYWSLAPRLARAGHCVYAFNYGNRATNAVASSAVELSVFVDTVLRATGAQKVNLVGHSQGGMMPRYYLRYLGGAAKVEELVGIAPSNHGTTSPIVVPLGFTGTCWACTDQVAVSAFLRLLNNPGDVVPGVHYTVLITRHDVIVTPYPSQALTGPAAQVTNVTLQRACPANFSDHANIVHDPVATQWILHALDRNGPADPAFRPRCA